MTSGPTKGSGSRPACVAVCRGACALVLCVAAANYGAAADLGGTLVATTDYINRGLTQTDHGGAVQGDVHLRSKGWFGGVWASMALSDTELAYRTEFNGYVGYAWTVTPDWTASVHYARYLYGGGGDYARYYYDDYDEVQAAVSFQSRARLSVALAPDILRYSFANNALERGKQWSYEGSYRHPLARGFSVTAGVGYYDLQDLFARSYWAWSGGVEFGVRQLQLNLTRFATDDQARRLFGRQTADGRWALTAAWRF